MDSNKYELDVDKISKITDIMLNKFEKDAKSINHARFISNVNYLSGK